MVVPPGVTVPVVRAVQFCVRLLSEYMARFMAVIVPVYGTVWEVVSIPEVVRARTVPVNVRAIMTAIIFALPIFWSIFTGVLPAKHRMY